MPILRDSLRSAPVFGAEPRPAGPRSVLVVLVVVLGLLLAGIASPPASAAGRPIPALITTAGVHPAVVISTNGAMPAVTGRFGIRVVHQPTDDVSDPRGYYYVVGKVKPGAVIHRKLEVDNSTSAASRFFVYAAAASLTGGNFLGAAGRTPNQLSSWTRVTPEAPVTASGAAVAINVTIAVPRNVAPGVRYGVVWAEMRGGGGAGVSQACRVGIRVYFTVLGTDGRREAQNRRQRLDGHNHNYRYPAGPCGK